MAYGLQISNSSGFVQIDQDFSNYVIVATGTTSITYQYDGFQGHELPGPTVAIPDYGVLPLVFIRNPGAEYVGMHSITNSTMRFIRTYDATTAAYSFDYMICIPAIWGIGGTSGYGFRVMKSDNTTVFDSGGNYPRVQDVFQLNNSAWTQLSVGLSAVVTNPWMMISNLVGTRYIGDGGNGNFGGYNFQTIRSEAGGGAIGLYGYPWYGGLGIGSYETATYSTIAVLKN